MSEADFLEYLREKVNGSIGDDLTISDATDGASFIYADVDSDCLWRVTVSRAEVK